MSSVAAVAYLMVASAYAGFQWTVQLVVYRQMTSVPAGRFAAYERDHRRRITPLVAVLFAALVLATAGLAFDQPWWVVVLAALPTITILAVTAFGAVPQHRRLQRGWDAGAHRRLLRWDLVRALAGTAAAGLGAWLVLR